MHCDSDILRFHDRFRESAGFLHLHLCLEKTLKEDKTRRRIEKVEKASDQNISMEEITDVVDNQAMWETWRKMAKAVKRGKCLSRSQLKLTTAIMATTVMLKSFQR